MPNLITKFQGIPMRRLYITPITLLACLVVGCSSFNNSFNTYTVHPAMAGTLPASQEPSSGNTTKPVSESNDKETDFKCPPFKYESSGRGPELPEDLMTAAGSDIHKIEELERQHIKDLRAHIAKMQRRLKQAMLEHEVQCRMAAIP